MNNEPVISVIIPAYNVGQYLAAAINSALQQTRAPDEIIVVDDGSTDKTPEVAKSFGGRVKYLRQENAGPAAARNLGIREAKCEWVAFLDGDDLWLPWHLSEVMKVKARYPDAALFCGRTIDIDEDFRYPGQKRPVVARKMPLGEFVRCNPVATSTVVVRKDAVISTGGFDPAFRGPEDYDLWMRIAADYHIIYIDIPLVRYRNRPGSLSMDDRKFLPEVLKVIDKAYGIKGALHFMRDKKRTQAYQYQSAAWMASERDDNKRALGLLKRSFYLWPWPFPDPCTFFWRRISLFLRILSPTVSIDLMYSQALKGSLFFQRLVLDLYNFSKTPHPKLPIVKQFEYGVALCRLPASFDEYLMGIEASARRNYKKARGKNYEFRMVNYDNFLKDVADILRSANVRQGKPMPREFLEGEIKGSSSSEPASGTDIHDYRHFGVLLDGKLVAYAGCFICGEAFMIEQIYGHAKYLEDGIMAMLIIDIAGHILNHYKKVKYYIYGTFFGARRSMKRFKKKFMFMPHHVKWILGFHQSIYRQERHDPFAVERPAGVEFHLISGPLKAFGHLRKIKRIFGLFGLIKACLKVATPSREFYCLTVGEDVVNYGWLTFSRCRQYHIEPGDIVIGPVWTNPDYRGKGMATIGLNSAANAMIERKHYVFFIDAAEDNLAMQKVIAKCGFGPVIRTYRRGNG